MLVSLPSSLHADMMDCMENFKAKVGELGGSIDHIEKKMGEYASSYTSPVDAHNDQSDEVAWLKSKIADMVDRSSRNNVKILGIPESTQPAKIRQYTCDLMKAFFPFVPDSE